MTSPLIPRDTPGQVVPAPDAPPMVKVGRWESVRSGRKSATGWRSLDGGIRDALQAAGLREGKPIIEWIDPAQTRRGGPLGYRQHAGGWWVTDTRAVQFSATRDLEHLGSSRFRSVEPWAITAVRHPYSGPPTIGRRRIERSARGERIVGPAVVVETDDPVELLPADVADLVRGGQVAALRQAGRREAHEMVWGLRISGARLGAVYAERSTVGSVADGSGALAGRQWTVLALEAAVGPTARLDLGDLPVRSGRRSALGRRRAELDGASGRELGR